MAQSRLVATHLSHQLLPDSLTDSKCKIIYVTRNPFDQFISEREFGMKVRMRPDLEPLGLEQSFDMFCRVVHGVGPFWDNILGYWIASLQNPDRILFLKYEEMKTDTIAYVDKIADFVGLPFSNDERKRGYIEEISSLCSFEKLMNLEVNKNGHHHTTISNSYYYRKGEIGDWKNHLTSEMGERLRKIMDEKMGRCGLNLVHSSNSK
ncbi:hypothetical protein ACS0TY_026152 [Phlomoides rotata]